MNPFKHWCLAVPLICSVMSGAHAEVLVHEQGFNSLTPMGALPAGTSFNDGFGVWSISPGGEIHIGDLISAPNDKQVRLDAGETLSYSFSAVALSGYDPASVRFTWEICNCGPNPVNFTFAGPGALPVTPAPTGTGPLYGFKAPTLSAGIYTLSWAAPNSFDFDNFKVYASMAAVPEPETYALMMLGLGVVGFAARKKARKA